jgi:hypothetical protein
MNREDIIRMAREAGFERLGHTDDDWVCYPKEIEAFAESIRNHYSYTHAQLWLKRIANAVKAEREACAKLCWSQRKYWDAEACADAIRARGNK